MTTSVIPSPTPILNRKGDNEAYERKYESAQYRLNRLQTEFNLVLAIFTGALVIVGGLQAWRLRQTLDHMRESSEKELRAYVNLSGAKVLNIAKPNERKAQVQIKNFGQTPAYKVKFVTAVHTRELPVTSIFLPVPMNLPNLSTDVLAPTRILTLDLSISALDAWEESELQNVRAAIYVWGRVTYTDAFGKDRWTDFRLFCGGDGLPQGRLTPHQHGNDSN